VQGLRLSPELTVRTGGVALSRLSPYYHIFRAWQEFRGGGPLISLQKKRHGQIRRFRFAASAIAIGQRSGSALFSFWRYGAYALSRATARRGRGDSSLPMTVRSDRGQEFEGGNPMRRSRFIESEILHLLYEASRRRSGR